MESTELLDSPYVIYFTEFLARMFEMTSLVSDFSDRLPSDEPETMTGALIKIKNEDEG